MRSSWAYGDGAWASTKVTGSEGLRRADRRADGLGGAERLGGLDKDGRVVGRLRGCGLRGAVVVLHLADHRIDLLVDEDPERLHVVAAHVVDVALDVARDRRLDGADDVDQLVLRPHGKCLDHIQILLVFSRQGASLEQ